MVKKLRSAIPAALLLSTVALTASALAKPIYVWDPVAPENMHGKGLKAIYDEWNKRHPDMKIIRTYVPDVLGKMTVAIAGGTPPDLVYFPRNEIGTYAARGMLTNLDPFIKRSKIKPDDFFAAAWDESKWGKNVYCIPHQVDTRALMLISKTLKEAGLDSNNSPKTLDELALWATKITRYDASGKLDRLGFDPWAGNWWFLGWLWTFGGELLNPDKTKVAFNGSEGKKAIKWMTDFQQKINRGFAPVNSFYGKYPPNVLARTGGIQRGFIGMQIEGDWMLEQCRTYAQNQEFHFAPVPTPSGKDNITWIGGWSFVIPKRAKNQDQAWRFIEYMASYEGQLLSGTVSGRIPALRAAAYSKEFLDVDKRMITFVNMTNYGRYRPSTPAATKLWNTPNFEIAGLISSGKMSPEAALDWAAKEVQKEIDRYRKLIK